ncbi:MAG: hypothetical protein QXP77_00060 [Candidatus Aenigmatarchaeota archaeon]
MVTVKFIIEVVLLILGLAIVLIYFYSNYESISKAFFEWLNIYLPK